MTDHSITFTKEQNLYLDSLVEKQKLTEETLLGAQKLIESLQQKLITKQEQLTAAHQVDQKQPVDKEEEAIRADERERIAAWLEEGGHDDEYLYMMTNGTAANAMQTFLPDVIRRQKHNLSYAEYQRESEPTWPEDYMKKEADYDFDVYAKPHERRTMQKSDE